LGEVESATSEARCHDGLGTETWPDHHKHLEDALALADEINDGATGFLIERALDEARSWQFRPIG